ncbi:MATE family efflux transporter [Daejeonella oryzae]|uniref:hypothetical protein n=1 Tax=Daejeonella oryzae TaxID=1122943 RepID=UPI00047E4644|nr:hypothetical protein [Daejeonella oryzae]
MLSELFKNNKIRYSLYILIAQGLFMLSNLYINHWISKTWDVEGFATYNLVKRISAFIAFPLLIGAGIGIPRYISFLKTEINNQSVEYLISGLLLFLSSFLVFTGIVFIFPQILLKAFEDSSFNSAKIILSVLIFVFSQGLYILLNAYYRGRIQFGLTSLWNVLIMSILPLLVLFFVPNVFVYFYYYSLGTIILIGSIFVYLGRKSQISGRRIKYKSLRLFKYGYPRIIADLGLFSLEFIPIFLVSLYIGLAESGYLSMSFILLKLASMVFELVGSLILPYFGKLFKNESSSVFISKVNQLLVIGVSVSVLISIVMYFLIPVIISEFFPALEKSILPSQLIFIVFPVYAMYLLLRNILDVVINKAYNSINLSIVFVIQLIILGTGFYFNNFIIYSVMSVLIPYFILGLLTYWVWTKMRRTLKHG